MADTAADILFDTIAGWGVDTVFGLPGDGINGLMEALRRRQDRLRFIQVRHEESAALMACGHARYTGRLGVCLATSGPGGIHLLSGLYNARLERLPVLAITGHHYHDLIGTMAQQDVALDRLFADATVYSERVMGPAHAEGLANAACRAALSLRGAAHINFPADTQSQSHEQRSERNVPHHEARLLSQPGGVPGHSALQEAAALLDRAERVAIVAGQGAQGAAVALEELADRLGAPVIRSLQGTSVLPDDSPVCVGSVGPAGSPAVQQALVGCDVLLLVGTSSTGGALLPEPGSRATVQIDIDPARLGLHYPVTVGLLGDAGRTLQRLLPLLRRKPDRSFLEGVQRAASEWTQAGSEQGPSEPPLQARSVAYALGRHLSERAIVSSDSGSAAAWTARLVPVRRGQLHSGTGVAFVPRGLPYAIAAQLAFPERQSVAVVGEAGLASLMAEYATAVKYRLPVRVVVLKEHGGDRRPSLNFAAFARACGGVGLSVTDAAELDQVFERLFSAQGPALVEVQVQVVRPAPVVRAAPAAVL